MSAPSPVFSLRGTQDELVVFSDHLTITPKGLLGFLNKGLKGTKTIPFTSVTAIQVRKASLLAGGYIQFTLPGGNEAQRGLLQATQDENTVMFSKPSTNDLVERIKLFVEEKMKQSHRPKVQESIASQLEKLGQLRASGDLTPEEFAAAKSLLLREAPPSQG